jgi:histone H3/H4
MAEEFTIAPFRRLLKKEGDLFISSDGLEEMRRIVGNFSKKLAQEAVINTLKNERKIILEKDIKMAYTKIKKLEGEETG